MSVSAPSHHRAGGGFRNPWPDSEPRGFLDLLRWMVLGRLVKRRPPDPERSVFVRKPSAILHPRATDGHLSATWVGHSTVLLQVGALNVLTDPMWSARASPVRFAGPKRWVDPGVLLDALPPIDVVLLSHNHYDHLDDRTVRRLAAAHPEAAWVTPLGLAEFVRHRGARTVVELDWWQDAEVGSARVMCVPAQHFSARRLGDRGDTLWCGWILRSERWSIYFGGDSAFHPEFGRIGERFGPFDLTMLPIGAYDPRWFMRSVHMNPEEAVRAFQQLNAGAGTRRAALLPIHWGTFKLTDEPMDEPPARLRRAWTAGAAAELWLLAHGETRCW